MSERRAGRRPAQPKKPPPFALFFRDFPRRDFLEAEKGVVFRGLRFYVAYISIPNLSLFTILTKYTFCSLFFTLSYVPFFFLLFSLSFYINIEKNRCSEWWLNVGGCVGVGMLSCIACGLSWFSDVVKCE